MGKRIVKYDYDYNNDSLFIYCVNPYEYEVSLELDNDVILDIDTEGKPVAFEFLNASTLFGLDKNYFKKLGICIQSEITEDFISLTVRLSVLVHNKNQVFDINRIISNTDNISILETELVTA